MSIRVPTAAWKALGLLLVGSLTPAVAPYLEGFGSKPSPTEPVRTSPPSLPPRAPPPQPTRIRAEGTGPSAETAFQSAVDAALRRAVAAEVSAADWQDHGPAHLATLRQNGSGVLRGWQEVSSSSERRLTGRVFRSEVTVEVDVEALRQRLRLDGHVIRR